MTRKPTYEELEKRVRTLEQLNDSYKKSAVALKDCESKYLHLIGIMMQGVILQDAMGNIIEANSAACDILGCSLDQMLGKPISELEWELVREDGTPYPPDELPFNLALKTGKGVKDFFCGIHVPPKLEYGWIAISSAPQFRDGEINPCAILSVFTDITEHRQAQDALCESEARYRTLFDKAPIGIGVAKENGNLLMFNDAMLRPGGYERGDIPIIKNVGNLYYDSQERDHVMAIAMAQGYVDDLPVQFKRKDGTPYDALLSLRPIHFDGANCWQATVQDITEKKKVEQQLRRFQKLEAIGTLAGGIAHDFNNMLSIIIGNISFALSLINPDVDLYSILSDALKGAKRAQHLTQQLLTFAKGGEPVKTAVNINQLIVESAEFVSRGAKSKLDFRLADNLWAVKVDSGQLNQVISNLIINANQAMPEGGTIRITTENIISRTEMDSFYLPDGNYVKIRVEDQGVGISEKHIVKIFDPYFSTKQQGSGLGLAITYSIVNKHGGHIAVYSEVEKGTAFNIYLPAHAEEIQATQDIDICEHRGQGTILIMDDQEPVRKIIGRMLNSMGYQTVFAQDGSQAIAFYREALQAEKTFDLVILDLTVPGGMGGAKTIPELLRMDPNVKAVVSSGYSNDPIMANYEDYGFCGVVPKPYTRSQLAGVLNRILG